MSGYTNAIIDEEFLKSAFNKFVEYGGTYASTEEEFIKSNFHTLQRVVETMPIQTRKAIADHFLDLCFQQDATALQFMEIACNLETE